MNKPDPIHSEDIREQLEDYFYQALEVELLLRLFPDDEDTICQIVDLLVDTCATKRRMMGTLPAAFANPLPSLHPLDLLIGISCGAGLRLAV